MENYRIDRANAMGGFRGVKYQLNLLIWITLRYFKEEIPFECGSELERQAIYDTDDPQEFIEPANYQGHNLFNDVVLKVHYKKFKETVCLASRYKNKFSERHSITASELQTGVKKKGFPVDKFFRTFCCLQANTERMRCVGVFTNRMLSFYKDSFLLKNGTPRFEFFEVTEKVEGRQLADLFRRGQLFKFNKNLDRKCLGETFKTNITEPWGQFLENIVWAVEQVNFEELDAMVKKEVEEAMGFVMKDRERQVHLEKQDYLDAYKDVSDCIQRWFALESKERRWINNDFIGGILYERLEFVSGRGAL